MAELGPLLFLCSVCGEGGVLLKVRTGPSRREGDHVVVELFPEDARCDHCGAEYRVEGELL